MNRKKNLGKNILITSFVILLLLLTFGMGYMASSIFGNNGAVNPTPSGDSTLTTFNAVRNVLRQEFYYGENTDEYDAKLIDDALRGMVSAQNDPYTEYMSPDELAEFTSSLTANFVGIGVRYTSLESGLLISEVLDFSPALEAGVQAGDIIIAVDGRPVSDFEEDELLNNIRGLEGTKVTITVLRDNEHKDITITRGQIYTTVSSSTFGKVGLLTLSSFADGSVDEVGRHLEKLHNAGCTSLIIDLRDNGGGYVTTLDGISAFFMKKGDVIMREYDRNGNEIVDKCTRGPAYSYDKIIILINGNSASCSEVFTMAMKENCNATVVGDVSYGKGVAQVTRTLRNGGAIKYTDVIWKSGNGVDISGNGITPDVPVRLHEVLYRSYLIMAEDEVISYDSVNEKVVDLQYMLDFLGYEVDRFDGYFSLATQKALKQYQGDHKLTVSGDLDQASANSLNSQIVTNWNLHPEIYDLQLLKAIELAQ